MLSSDEEQNLLCSSILIDSVRHISIINEGCNLLHIAALLRKVESQVSGTTEIQDEPGANVLFARMIEWIIVRVAIVYEPP